MTDEVIKHSMKTNMPLGSIPKKQAHAEQMEAHKASKPQPHKHEHIGVVLLKQDGDVLCSLRPFDSGENPDMLDKSVGGHVLDGFFPTSSAHEMAFRELDIPIALVSGKDLETILLNHPSLLHMQAFVTELDYDSEFISERMQEDGSFRSETCMQTLLLGAYFTRSDPALDSGARRLVVDRILEYAKKFPTRVTRDLTQILGVYRRQIERLSNKISRVGTIDTKHTELVRCYDLQGEGVAKVPRKEVHLPIIESFKAGKEQEMKHQHIGGLLVGNDGRIYIQIRSRRKSENPDMYDKLVGGHIPLGDSEIVAAYHEFGEEMRIPVTLYGKDNWLNVLKQCPDITSRQAICKEPIKVENFVSKRVRTDGNSFDEICDQYFLIGRYDGPFRMQDKESGGVFVYDSREELAQDMKEDPAKYTDDLKYMVKLFWDDLVPIQDVLEKEGAIKRVE